MQLDVVGSPIPQFSVDGHISFTTILTHRMGFEIADGSIATGRLSRSGPAGGDAPKLLSATAQGAAARKE